MNREYTYEQFKDKLKDGIDKGLSEKYGLTYNEHIVHRTNEVLEGMTLFADGCSVAPTIYPEKIYDTYLRGESADDVINAMVYSLDKEFENLPRVPEISREAARKNISFSLINEEKNKNMLQTCPYEKHGDLAAVPKWHIDKEHSFLVNNKTVQALHMTNDEVLEIARGNTLRENYKCQSMNEIMKEMMHESGMSEEFIDEMISTEKVPLYVLSNEDRLDGSKAILSDKALQEAKAVIGEDFYILPSSRHEVICVPESTVQDTRELKEMVKSVNAQEVSIEDYLSDSVYHYDGKTHQLSVSNEEGLFETREKNTYERTTELDGRSI